MPTRAQLTDSFDAYCTEHTLKNISADELLYELQDDSNTNSVHMQWLTRFIYDWELMEFEEYENFKGD